MPSFWKGGHDAYLDGLYQDYVKRREQLKTLFQSANCREDKLRVAKAVEALDEEYERNVNNSRNNIY